MQSYLFSSIFLLLDLIAIATSETINQNNLQRGGKSINWVWSSDHLKGPDILRRRRYLIDESSDQWWNDMKTIWDPTDGATTTVNPLSPEEDIYFSGRGRHSLPISNFQSLPALMNTTVQADIRVDDKPQNGDIDSSLIRELIIEEHHKPSKIELESLSQRLRDISENNTTVFQPPIKTENMSKPEELREIESEEPVAPKYGGEKPLSYVEYVVPGVERVEPYVEYVNKHDAYRESEGPSQQPFVEYIVPSVEYVEPEIEYFTTTRMSNVSKNVESFPLDDSSEEETFGKPELPIEEVITTDQNRFLAVHNEEKITSETQRAENQRTVRQSVRHRRTHKRNQGWGIPEVDYPTLEIVPVVHFPCEEYPSPGYYADVSSRCQMFHICHENGQRSSFLCPIGTVFNQEYLVCDWWYNVECENTLNHHLTDSYEAFGTSNEKISLPLIAKQNEDSHSLNKDNGNQPEKLSLFSAGKIKPEVNRKFQHDRKTTERHPNLSQKAINYPIGYAVLLREFVKNSPQFMPNAPEYSKHTENSNTMKYENISESPNLAKTDRERENALHRNDENSNNKENIEETMKERKKQEYYGGSKPFSVSEKRVHESVRTKRIKIKYFPRNSQEFSPVSNHTPEETENDPASDESLKEYISQAPSIPQYGAKTKVNRINGKEDRLSERLHNKTIIVVDKPVRVPDNRNYYNITDDFEVIHLQQGNSHHKNKLVKKYPKHRYSSSASIVNYKKEPYSDEEDQFGRVDDLYHLENTTETRNDSNQNHIAVSQNKHSTTSVPFFKRRKQNRQSAVRAHRRPVSKNMLVTTISESTIVKKSYTVEPAISLAKLNRKYGQRINTKLPTSKYEKLVLYETTPVFEDKVKSKTVNVIQKEQFPVEKHKTTTPLTPVYIHTSTYFDNESKSRSQKKMNDSYVSVKSQTNKNTLKKNNVFVIPVSPRKKNDTIVSFKSNIDKNIIKMNSDFAISDSQKKKNDSFVTSGQLNYKNITNSNATFDIPQEIKEANNLFVTSKSLVNHTNKSITKNNFIFNIPQPLIQKKRTVDVPESQIAQNATETDLKSQIQKTARNVNDEDINKNLTEFDITSKFVSRISNFVSEIKAPSEDVQQNLLLQQTATSTDTKNASFIVNVPVVSESFPNSTKNSSAKQLKNSTDLIRTLQPWLINKSVSHKMYNYNFDDQKERNFTIQHLWSDILNKNTAKINNAHGGFLVVKKIRLKRDTTNPLRPQQDQYLNVLERLKIKLKNLLLKIAASR